MPSPRGDITVLLSQLEGGDDSARDQLLDLAYQELRQIAGDLMRHERGGHTLQPTALVHEAAIRVFGKQQQGLLPSRGYFFATMAQAMRRILVEHARRRRAKKRGGDQAQVPLDAVIAAVQQTHRIDLLDLDAALDELASEDERAAEVVTLRFFGGMEMQDISEHLNVSLSTIERDWRFSRAWLKRKVGN